MGRHHLYESVPNFSEGTRADVIAELAGALAGAHVIDVDADADHNRVVISVVGQAPQLIDALVASVHVAIEHIDLRQHEGVHPRVGAADVIPIVPLGDASLADAHELARTLGDQVWTQLRVPVYFYGHGEEHTLADIRGGRARPTLGGHELHPSAGAVCIGARHPLVAFNVILPGWQLPEARALARSLRESGGGLRGVQALVFELGDGRVQLSMNLFRLEETPPSVVIAELERRGELIGSQHVIGLCPANVAIQAAAGRLLEARLAAAVARRGAQLCAARGDEKSTALAARLEREATELAHTGIDQDALLVAAKRSAALLPVLRTAAVLGDDMRTMVDIAVRGLRSAALRTD
jgi:glutamate formiminotransferase